MKRTTALILPVLIIMTAFLLLELTGCSSPRAAIKESKEVIKTYPFSEPDPVPILTRSSLWGKGARLYPYCFFDKFSKTAVDKEWNVVRMENPYIEVSVLPQVGGKIWGATEKSTGREFIYTNHVLKFREIALRGPWTSGGIEFNFGIVGHTPAGAAPVDYMMRKNPDGSVSCIVGTMDLPSRTRWSVTITLPRDKAYFETQAFWYNPSPLHQSYYAWMNGAIKTGEDLQYIFPGRCHIAHNFSVPLKPWPVDETGRDLSWYKNNNFGSYKSYFTVGEYENFFGSYWHDSEFGFGHWALYDDIPGQKIWIWGLSRQGAIWEDLLTDSDGQYSEPQAGRYLNQNDHGFFAPYSADRWREIWFPYKKIGPMVKASPYGILNVTQGGGSLTIGVCPLQEIDDDLVITLNGKERYKEHLRLKPMEVYEKELPLEKQEEEAQLQVRISNKLCYTNDLKANDLKRPINFHSYEEDTIEGLFLSAERFEKERNHYKALEKYLECLEREPLHMRALCRVAELYFRRAEYEKALTYVLRALENVMYDPEANYIYGIISRRMGDLVEAKESMGWAARSMRFRSSAYCQMAEINFLEKNPDLALEYACRSLDFNKYNMNAYQVMAVIYRSLNQPENARRILNRLLEIEPLNHMARFEFYLLDPDKRNLEDFQSMIRNELPQENYLEIALYYAKLGLGSDAVRVLELAPEYPTVYYWLAYLLKDETPDKSGSCLNKAYGLSPTLVFPFREESIPVFKWAYTASPADWKARYYHALILWSKGRMSEARKLLDECGSPEFAPLYIARGYVYKEINSQKALSDFKDALRVDRKSWKTWHHLIAYYNDLHMFDESLALVREGSSTFPDEGILRIDLIRSLISSNFYKEALSLLESTEALPYEGASEIHSLFVDCQIELGLNNMREKKFAEAVKYLEGSKRYPENLGTGRPYDPDFRMQDYLEAVCYDRVGKKEKAEETRKAVYDYTLKHWPEQGKYQYFGGLILQHFGEHDKARQLLNKGKPPKKVMEIIKGAGTY